MDNSTLHAAVLQDCDEPLETYDAAPRLCPDILHADKYATCPWATSAFGFDWNSEKWHLVAVTCKRWGCPYCAIRKIRRLAWMSRNACPNKLITVTVSTHRYATPTAAWEKMAPAWPELVRYARRNFGDVQYLRILELTKKGTPHFHSMVRSRFLPHQVLLNEWRRLIGEPDEPPQDSDEPEEYAGLNIKAIDKSFATFRYLVKYLCKLKKLEWTDRHVSYSREFFREEDKEKTEYAKLDQVQKNEDHPFKFLKERYGWRNVIVAKENCWVLPTYPPDPEIQVTNQDLGLPWEKPAMEESTPQQRLVPGIAAEDLLPEDDGIRPDGSRKRSRRTKTIAPTAHTPAATAADNPKYKEF